MAQPMGSVAAPASSTCSGWGSLTRPPDSIRVLRRKSGRIETVQFRKYVVTVMGKEWPSYLPQSLVEAGAVAVKQYAWYHAVYSSRASDGRCYDVRDGTSDQLYKPGRARISSDHYHAVDATWNVTIRKDGRFMMTGYRRGEKVRCGRDATGYKLFAMSGIDCARKGLGWRQILRTYYGPGMSLVGDGVASSQTDAAASPPPPETGVAQTPATPAPELSGPSGAIGAVGGAQSGGLADAVVQHEQRLLLLWLGSNSLV